MASPFSLGEASFSIGRKSRRCARRLRFHELARFEIRLGWRIGTSKRKRFPMEVRLYWKAEDPGENKCSARNLTGGALARRKHVKHQL